jgi:hypothetical protein
MAYLFFPTKGFSILQLCGLFWKLLANSIQTIYRFLEAEISSSRTPIRTKKTHDS